MDTQNLLLVMLPDTMYCEYTQFQGVYIVQMPLLLLNTYIFFYSMPNLDESINPLMIAVQGRSLMPYCHFELDHSDYLTSGRRSANQRGPFGSAVGTALDINTKVIEFHSCGVGVKDSK